MLDRWNPLTVLAAVVLLIVLAYAGPPLWGAIAAVVLAVGGAWALGIGRRVTTLAIGVAVPTAALLFAMAVLAPDPGAPRGSLGPLTFDAAQVRAGLIVALQLGAAVAALGWIVIGVSPRRLTRALAARGLPAWAAYVLVASLDAVPEARRRADDVIAAQRCRGLAMSGGLAGRVRALVPLVGPVVVSLVTESEERALALDARGFEPSRARSALVPIADRRGERVVRLVTWAASLALVVARFASLWRSAH